MKTNFTELDKSDFKCLKTSDGAIYYGQCVQILPPAIQTDKLTGFAPREDSQKPIVPETSGSDAEKMLATHSSAGGSFRMSSAAGRPRTAPDPFECLYQEGVQPLVVEDISQIDEELLPKLVTVRHGNGIQI